MKKTNKPHYKLIVHFLRPIVKNRQGPKSEGNASIRVTYENHCHVQVKIGSVIENVISQPILILVDVCAAPRE